MNVYDTVNKLAQEIKTSEEYTNFKNCKEKIKSNAQLNEKIKQFEKSRYEVQILALQGQQIDKDKEKEMQDMYAELLKIDEVKEYFDSEFKFNILLADVNRIIGESVKDVLE